jgi:hypothetical protein
MVVLLAQGAHCLMLWCIDYARHPTEKAREVNGGTWEANDYTDHTQTTVLLTLDHLRFHPRRKVAERLLESANIKIDFGG